MRELAGSPQVPSKRRDLAWLWTASVFTFLAVAIASCWMSGPIIHADEGGYLLNAATITGRVRTSVIWGSNYSGYSLLLAPAWWLFSRPMHIYHAALLINALLIATVPLGLYQLLSSLLPRSDPKLRLLAALAGAWHTPVLAMGLLAFSENALIPCYVCFAACLARAAEDLTRLAALLAGALGGCLYLIHPRGALLAIPLIACVAIWACWRRREFTWTLVLLVSALAVASLHSPLEQLAGKHAMVKDKGYDPMFLLHAAFDPANWSRLLVDFVGISAYALASSVGLAALAVEPGRKRQSPCGGNEGARAVILGMGAALFACIAVAAIYVVYGRRIDYLIHGRYVVP